VAGAEALSYFESSELMDEVADKTRLTRQLLQPLLNSDSSLQLRGKGLIIGLDVGDGERAAAIVKRCFEDGLIIASCGSGGRVLKLIPPLTIPEDDLVEGLDILINSVRSVMEEAA
ncbi:MAG: aminotransferase class III-fold pyridoxal phosphate-dependent enzyme, partial [Ketobacter sp.]